jgi:hypothetical protein
VTRYRTVVADPPWEIGDFPGQEWFIDIASLDDLMAFYEKHGELVLTATVGDESVPCIEIYDGYRE